MDRPLLEVEGLLKDYPGTRALDHVDLTVRAGEVHALLGENGAGKSTLIKVLAGVVPADAGIVRFGGETVEIRDARDARELGISVIHQQRNLVEDLTVAENMVLGEGFPRRGPFVDRRRMIEDAQPWLERVGLDAIPNRPVRHLRPHEAAMVCVARAIRSKARLIILDEPTTAMTPHEVATLFGHIRNLAAQGVAFIYVSHRLAEVFDISDQLTVLRGGQLVGTWPGGAEHQDDVVSAIVGSDRKLYERSADEQERGEVVLQVEGVHVSGVLEGVDYEVHRHEVVGLAGLAGSGAEEAAGAPFHEPPADRGRLRLNGRELSFRHPADARDAGIAFVPKDRHAQALLHGFSIRENLTIASTRLFRRDPISRWLRRSKEHREAQRIVEELRVKTPSVTEHVDALSGGNQQKVVIGRWFTRPYELYVFVDPCAGVDIHSKAEIYELIRTTTKAGAGAVFTSSEVEEYPRVCDRVLVFHEGEIVGELTGADITEEKIMRLALSGALQTADGRTA